MKGETICHGIRFRAQRIVAPARYERPGQDAKRPIRFCMHGVPENGAPFLQAYLCRGLICFPNGPLVI